MTPAARATASYDGLAEATVVGRAQDGDLDAFAMLVNRYQTPLFRLALQLLHDRGAAEDAVQDSLVLVWRRLPTLADPAAFHGWVYQLTTRRCLDLLRRTTRRAVQPSELLDQLPGPSGSDPAERAVQTARLAALQTRLGDLPEPQRVCWVLRELHGLSYAEIATTMQLSVSTVRGRIARARLNLTEGMASWR